MINKPKSIDASLIKPKHATRPKWARFVAIDDDGRKFWFECLPRWSKLAKAWYAKGNQLEFF